MTPTQDILPTHERLKFLRSRLACKKPGRMTLFVVPWINIALLMFIFQHVHSQRLLSPGISLNLPAAPFTGGAPVGSEVVTVLRNGSLFFHDERVALDNLTAALRRAGADGTTLMIEADGGVTHERLTAVYNAAQAAGFREIVLATRLPDGGADGARDGR